MGNYCARFWNVILKSLLPIATITLHVHMHTQIGIEEYASQSHGARGMPSGAHFQLFATKREMDEEERGGGGG